MAHPAVLHNLAEEYQALAALDGVRGIPGSRRRLDDLAHGLCIATGTSDVDAALVAARFHLPGARPEDDSAALT